jgi:hypothetical protein
MRKSLFEKLISFSPSLNMVTLASSNLVIRNPGTHVVPVARY